MDTPTSAIVTHLSELRDGSRLLSALARPLVFTNGCFDLLHPGHLYLLRSARSLGRSLVVGLNSDASVRAQKKAGSRPFVAQKARAEMLAAIIWVNAVVIFDDSTPLQLIRIIQPDVLVKGTDWGLNAIAGAELLPQWGGKVVRIALREGYSTTQLAQSIKV